MKNNKRILRGEIKVGTRIKMAIPTFWAYHKKDRLKKYSWWKGKIIDATDSGAFTVYLGSSIGRIFVPCRVSFKIVKCL